MRLLFLTTRLEKPSYRFRIAQVLPCFRERYHTCETALLPDSFFDRMGLFRTVADYDAVILHRRMLNRLELGVLFGFARNLIFDFDDAVLFDSSGESRQRSTRRFKNIVSAADCVIAGNNYLANEARRFSSRVRVVPTPIDTERFSPTVRADDTVENDGLCRIGWTGSRPTMRYLSELFPVLAKLRGRISVQILTDSTDGIDFQRLGDVPYEVTNWSPENESSIPAGFDIGIMPLPDDRWTRGKCGLKALQYMALGIPAVCSRVGVNRKIITHGENGFLPKTPYEWLVWLTELIENPRLRQEIGAAGRRRVEAAFSLRKLGPLIVEAVEETVESKRRPFAA